MAGQSGGRGPDHAETLDALDDAVQRIFSAGMALSTVVRVDDAAEGAAIEQAISDLDEAMRLIRTAAARAHERRGDRT